jgi:hypothetical protein
MDRAKEGEGSALDVLKSAFTSEGSTTAATVDEDATIATSRRSASPSAASKGVKRNSTFKIVPKRESMLLPEVGHERGWIRKTGEKDDVAAEGEGWKSSAYVFSLDT